MGSSFLPHAKAGNNVVAVTARTILVIDDDPDIRGDLRSILEDQGYRVVTAPDGKAGLEKAFEGRPDLVIVDMMMPRMSGFVVLERLKQSAQAIPVIMLTGNESDQQRTFAEFLGVDAYLNKPIGVRQLLDQVQRLCPLCKPPTMDPTPVPIETTI